MTKLYTIGHSNHKIDEFILLLRKYQINCVIDVRSTPYSRFSPQFSSNEIKSELNKNGIYYIFMGNELGARRKDISLYTKEGYLDFEKTSKNPLFLKGLERVKEGIERGYTIALMCTEKDPLDCHRNILVAREFYKLGYDIHNILANGIVETQKEIEKRLLDEYFPNRDQVTIFELISDRKDMEDLINEAYLLRNKEIGHIRDSEKEGENS
ncbi:DUF488 domain-containing protein [Anoxynatronum sibiricum]|uniref:DUF488 domain-containing protein n=1 Tax=Anoxynatronum sibiricum TaxID=210623 RepID=A0ABU9VWP9_9CLOT